MGKINYLNRSNNSIKFANSTNLDSFGRLRISSPLTIFDSKNIYNDTDLGADEENLPLFYDNQEVSGSGTSTTYNVNESSQGISVSANTAGKRVRQTKRRFNYQSGKSQLYLNSFIIGAQKDGITKREGYFDDNNGFFLEISDDVYLVRRTYVTGTPVDNKVAQSNWNVDTFDGTGPSSINLDFDKTQILFSDFEWLGVGGIRMGFVVDNTFYVAHEFLNANNLTKVYMSTPNLPIRSEISNDGTGDADSLIQICSSVISEGGQEDTGIIRYLSTAGTSLNANTENTIYCVLAIRLKTAYIGETIKQINANIQIQTASDRGEWILLFNPTIAGTVTYTGLSQSGIEYFRGATANTVTGGYQITGGFVESGGNATGAAGSTSSGLPNALSLGSNIDATKDIIVLAFRPIGGSTSVEVEGALTWRELS